MISAGLYGAWQPCVSGMLPQAKGDPLLEASAEFSCLGDDGFLFLWTASPTFQSRSVQEHVRCRDVWDSSISWTHAVVCGSSWLEQNSSVVQCGQVKLENQPVAVDALLTLLVLCLAMPHHVGAIVARHWSMVNQPRLKTDQPANENPGGDTVQQVL